MSIRLSIDRPCWRLFLTDQAASLPSPPSFPPPFPRSPHQIMSFRCQAGRGEIGENASRRTLIIRLDRRHRHTPALHERSGGYGLSRRCRKENGKDFGNSPCPLPQSYLLPFCAVTAAYYSPRPRRGTQLRRIAQSTKGFLQRMNAFAWHGPARHRRRARSFIFSVAGATTSIFGSLCDRSRRRQFRRKNPFPLPPCSLIRVYSIGVIS